MFADTVRVTNVCIIIIKGVGPQKLKFLLRLDQNVEYKRPTGAYPLRDFQKKIAEFVPHFRVR